MKFTFIFLTLSLLFALSPLRYAQKYDQHITIKRGDYKEFVFKHSGNITASDITFVVKLTKSFSSPRLIQKANDDTTEISTIYTSPYTYIRVKLLQSDTRDFTSAKYFYDIVADSTTIFDGELRVQQDVQTPFDGVDLPTSGSRFYVAGTFIDSTVADSSLFMWDSTSQTMKTVTKEQVRSYLDIEADLNSKVDLTSQQTITGQKNFSGTVKFRNDTSITVGGLVVSYPLGLDFFLKSGNNYQIPLRFRALDSNTADWTITTGEVDWVPSNVGKDHVFNFGYNWLGTKQVPQFGKQFEPNYESNDSTRVYEVFYYFNNLPSPNTTYGVRPFSLSVNQYPSGYMTEVSYYSDRTWINGINGEPKFRINANSIFSYLPMTFEGALDSADNITVAGNRTFIKLSNGQPTYRLGFGGSSANHLGIYYSNDATTALQINDAYNLMRFHPDSIYFNKYAYFGFNNSLGLSIIAGNGNASLKTAGVMSLDVPDLWIRNYIGNTINHIFSGSSYTAGSSSGTGTGAIYAGSYYAGSTQGYLSSSPGTLTASGLYVATSNGGTATRQLYYRTITINGVTMQILTLDTP